MRVAANHSRHQLLNQLAVTDVCLGIPSELACNQFIQLSPSVQFRTMNQQGHPAFSSNCRLPCSYPGFAASFTSQQDKHGLSSREEAINELFHILSRLILLGSPFEMSQIPIIGNGARFDRVPVKTPLRMKWTASSLIQPIGVKDTSPLWPSCRLLYHSANNEIKDGFACTAVRVDEVNLGLDFGLQSGQGYRFSAGNLTHDVQGQLANRSLVKGFPFAASCFQPICPALCRLPYSLFQLLVKSWFCFRISEEFLDLVSSYLALCD